MKLDYVSDIHLDFYVKPDLNEEKQYVNIEKFILDKLHPNIDSDTIIIAGDLSHYNNQIFIFFDILKNYYKHIIYVIGNHELYLISGKMKNMYKNSVNKIDMLKDRLSIIDNLYFLDSNSVNIDNVIISGSDLYGDFDFLIKRGYNIEYVYGLWKHSLSDYYYIDFNHNLEINGKKYSFDPYRYCKEKKESLKKASKDSHIIVTHVPPMYIETSFGLDETSTFFQFDGSDIIENCSNLKCWIFGHIHEITQKKIGNIDFLSNPYGYPTENNGFKGVKQIEIDI